MKKIVIAEKPSQMKSLKEALAPDSIKRNGYYENETFIFTNAIGHLFTLNFGTPKGEKWKMEKLPFLVSPGKVKKEAIKYYVPKENTIKQLNVIYDLLKRDDIEEVICSTDPDAEGETIYREIIESFKLNNEVSFKETRLIIKDTTPAGIIKQWDKREAIENYEGLRQRAYGRAIADYTIGINLTQALSLKSKTLLTVGRVQTPTLKLISTRYNKNKNHIKDKYYAINILSNVEGVILTCNKHKFKTLEEANNYIVDFSNLNITEKIVKSNPPKLYDLASIQEWGNKNLNLTLNEVLSVLQSLYDKGFLSYPRTDCKFITEETAKELESKYNKKLNPQVIGETTAHEGLTPTLKNFEGDGLSQNEIKIYQEINDVFKSNFYSEAQAKETTIELKVEDYEYKCKVNEIIEEGYLKYYNNEPFSNLISLPNDFDLVEKVVKEIETKPLPLYTESTLLKKMINIHNDEDFNEENKNISKEIEGIGTPATRGAIVESLFKKNYIEKKGKGILPTSKGLSLLKVLEESKLELLNLDYTALLEKELQNVEKEMNLENFIEKINLFTEENLKVIKSQEIKPMSNNSFDNKIGECPRCKKDLIKIKTKSKKNMIICSNKECNFNFPSYLDLTLNDVKKMLDGKKSRSISKVSKQGNEYKVKYFIKNGEIESEFANKK